MEPKQKKYNLIFLAFTLCACFAYGVFLTFGFGWLSACAVKSTDNNPDGGVTIMEQHPCIDTMTDFYNCGGCTTLDKNYICNPDTADVCKAGQCICSGVNAECEDGIAVCKLGTCANCVPENVEERPENDPKATICEWDHECQDNRMCVCGRCLQVPCADNGEPLIASCYTGGGNTFENPPCRKGYTVCFGGHWGPCLEEIVPVPEEGIFLCDEVDNNCDACPDGRIINGVCIQNFGSGIDIVFVFDTSPSMVGKCESVRTAMEVIGAGFNGNDNIRFAIVLMPWNGLGCEPGILVNLSDYATFQAALQGINCNNGPDEASWDTVYEIGMNNPLYDIQESALDGRPTYNRLSWHEGTVRVIIMFSDEEGQSYEELLPGRCVRYRGMDYLPINMEPHMCSAIGEGELLVVFNRDLYLEHFDECGLIYQWGDGLFGRNPDEMQKELEENLADALGHACDD